MELQFPIVIYGDTFIRAMIKEGTVKIRYF